MNLFTSIALFLSFSTTAIAGDRDSMAAHIDRGAGETSAESSIWPPMDDVPFPDETMAVYDDAETLDIEFLGSGEGIRGSHEYDFDIDGQLYTVEVRNLGRRAMLSLYDEDGAVVVGHVTGDRGALIYDDEGIVDRGTVHHVDMTVIEDYGSAAMLLTNPVFLMDFLEAQGEIFKGDDNPPAALWGGLLRCITFSYTRNSDGSWSITIGWDC
jgi:hypothetical protein